MAHSVIVVHIPVSAVYTERMNRTMGQRYWRHISEKDNPVCAEVVGRDQCSRSKRCCLREGQYKVSEYDPRGNHRCTFAAIEFLSATRDLDDDGCRELLRRCLGIGPIVDVELLHYCHPTAVTNSDKAAVNLEGRLLPKTAKF